MARNLHLPMIQGAFVPILSHIRSLINQLEGILGEDDLVYLDQRLAHDLYDRLVQVEQILTRTKE